MLQCVAGCCSMLQYGRQKNLFRFIIPKFDRSRRSNDALRKPRMKHKCMYGRWVCALMQMFPAKYTRTNKHIHTYLCTYTHTYIYLLLHIFTYIGTCVNISVMMKYIHICICGYMHTHTYIYVHANFIGRIYTHKQSRTHKYIYIQIHVHIWIDVYIYIHIHESIYKRW